MFPLTTHFEQLLQNIQPPTDRLRAAQELPPLVRDYLEDHEYLVTLAPHSRLAGSYAQHMCVGDVKDVDFLVRVSGDPESNEPEAKQLIRDLRTALDGLPEAIGLMGWADIDIETARRSVHVYFKGRDFHLDVVPCVAPDGFEKALYVPDRGFNKWIPSHPIGYIELLDTLNRENGKKVKPLGRLLKHFRNYQMKTRRPKSYWLGALLVHHVTTNLDMSESLATLFRDLVDAIYCQYDHLLNTSDDATPNIKDPMLGHNISWNWDRSHFVTFMARLDEARKWSSNALKADKRESAIGWWQKIFGDDFPAEVTEAAKRAGDEAFPGRSFVESTGLIVGSAPAESKLFIPTEHTTFHGVE